MKAQEKKRVLIIDDEPAFTRLLTLNLQHTGKYVTRAVNDAREAVSSAIAFTPDLILLDVMMPAIDGGSVAAEIHAIPKFKNTPIVFLTAAVRKQEIADRAGCIGGLPFVAKPVEFQEIVTCIDRQLHLQRSHYGPASAEDAMEAGF